MDLGFWIFVAFVISSGHWGGRWLSQKLIQQDQLSAALAPQLLSLLCWPFSSKNWTQLGNLLGDLHYWPQAQRCFLIARRLNPGWIEAHLGLGTAALILAPAQAQQHFQTAYHLRRGELPESPDDVVKAKPISVSQPRDPRLLQHEVLQLEWLLSQELLSTEWGRLLPGYQQALQNPQLALPPTYQRAIYLEQPVCLSPVLASQSAQTLKNQAQNYQEAGFCVIDKILSEAALQDLLQLCQRSTFWHHAYQNGYWGAYLDDGLNAPILYQLAEALKTQLPAIFGQTQLVYLWAFKAEAGGQGVALHHDSALVNLNLWLTPDHANRNPQTGGICIYPESPPVSWDLERYSLSPQQMQAFLTARQAQVLSVPYRQNRAVIFDSRFLHQTQDYDFKPGFSNQRINLTLLFGERPLRYAPRQDLPQMIFEKALQNQQRQTQF